MSIVEELKTSCINYTTLSRADTTCVAGSRLTVDKPNRLEMFSSWSVRVATEARVARRRSSHLYIFPYRGELLRVALLIQLSPSPSSRTSSTLLGLLSSPRYSGLVTRCLSSRVGWHGPARGPVCRGTGTARQRDHQCRGHTGRTGSA
ncbi:hypothetical protein DPMN_035711 [Dreissena polymorpha]|uniref:Uncharacterized protein n=1 Tax=Dreissena polymorpha TaxID=45954 RepID=A0A9D4M829_DREPO|nr:hypothetical protein DPMN_035711 [Dreissena polymorpha]